MVTCHTSWLAEVDWVAGSVPTVQMYPLRLEVKRQNECQRVGTECILEYSGVCDEPRRERLERNWVSASVENQGPGLNPTQASARWCVATRERRWVPNARVAPKSSGADTKFPVCS